MIRLELEQDAVVNGDHLRGHAEWTSDGKQPRKFEVICRWRVEGKGRKYEEVVDLELDVSPGAHATLQFDFKIPMAGPLTYDGKLFRIVWEIVARADLPMAFDEEQTKVFTVRPRRYVAEDFEVSEDEQDGEDDTSEEAEGS